MGCHLLRDLQSAAVLEVRCDACRPEGVAADLGFDPCGKGSPADHPPNVGLEQGIAGQLARPTARRSEERPLAVFGDAGAAMYSSR